MLGLLAARICPTDMRILSVLSAASAVLLLASAPVDATRTRHHVHKAHASAPSATVAASAASSVAQADGSLFLLVNPSTCAFSVGTSSSDVWLHSGDIGVHADGKWYRSCAGGKSPNCPGDHSSQPFEVQAVKHSNGTDSALGGYSETVCSFAGTGDAKDVRMDASIRFFPSHKAVVFTQHFPAALSATNVTDGSTTVASVFPAFAPASSTPLGFISYAGEFLGGHKQGVWGRSDATLPANLNSGVWAGPTVLFPPLSSEAAAAGEKGPAMVISSFSSFMSASAGVTSSAAGSAMPELHLGVQGPTENIPAGYSVSHVLVLGSQPGIHEALASWGRLLRSAYAKPERAFDADPFVSHLAYNTDRGAAYWYNTEKRSNYTDYEETLRAVKQEAVKLDIPYKSILVRLHVTRVSRKQGCRVLAHLLVFLPLSGGAAAVLSVPLSWTRGGTRRRPCLARRSRAA